jgi:uncharacterized phage protein gp47/JayE
VANNQINYVPQIDYTSRDYTSIRQDLINLIPAFNPAWTTRDPADFGITMVDLFSYMGDLINFYIDRATNEGFISTASQRESVLQMASLLGYTPTPSSAAIVSLTFTNTTGADVVVPAGTQIATTTVVDGISTQVIFETDTDATVPAAAGGVNGTVSVNATQGYTIADEPLGVSTGAPSQVFKLFNSPVIWNSIQVSVNGVPYSYSSSLIENNIYDPVFTVVNDADGYTYVVFGDGIGGRIPPVAGTITATYRVGAGAAGNVAAGSLTYFLSNVTGGVLVSNNVAAAGGADEESTDSIRNNAPLAMRALRRAVSLKDYAYLALQVSGVAKAVATASTFNSVTLYMAPFGDSGVDNVGGPSAAFTSIANDVYAYFVDKVAPNVTLTITQPTYVPIDLEVTVNVLPQYRQDIVTSAAMAAAKDLVSQDNSFFADRIPVQYILNAISAVPGVDYSVVTRLRKQTLEQSFTVNSYTRTSNVATITTSAAHNVTVGQNIRVTNTANGSSNVDVTSAVVTAVGSTTISYASIGGDLTSTTPSGAANAVTIVVETIICNVNEIPTAGNFVITPVGGIA